MTQTQATPNHLQKRLGRPFAIAVCVGTVVGTGIMRAPGEIANMVTDPAVIMLLWLAGGMSHTQRALVL